MEEKAKAKKPPVTMSEIRRVLGALGGRKNKGRTSPARKRASKENGRKGGRPKGGQMRMRLQG